METKDFEIQVLTDLASIKEMLKDYGRVKDDVSEALTLSRQNKEDNKGLKERIAKVENGIAEIKEKPAKRYDSIITYIITTIIGTVIGAIAVLIQK